MYVALFRHFSISIVAYPRLITTRVIFLQVSRRAWSVLIFANTPNHPDARDLPGFNRCRSNAVMKQQTNARKFAAESTIEATIVASRIQAERSRAWPKSLKCARADAFSRATMGVKRVKGALARGDALLSTELCQVQISFPRPPPSPESAEQSALIGNVRRRG
jgi:hypothetical protein